jgi:hypothetical protein
LAAASLAVSSPSTFSRQRAATYLPRLPALGYGAFSAFLTLSRPSSAPCLPALFHAGPALGVFPFRADSTREAFHSLECLFPLVVSSSRGYCVNRFVSDEYLGCNSSSSNRSSRSSTSLDLPHFRALLLTSVPVFCRSK